MNWYVWEAGHESSDSLSAGLFADLRGPHRSKAAAKAAVKTSRVFRVGEGLYTFAQSVRTKSGIRTHVIYIGSEAARAAQRKIAAGPAEACDPFTVEYYDQKKNFWRFGKCVEKTQKTATVVTAKGDSLELPIEHVRAYQAGS